MEHHKDVHPPLGLQTEYNDIVKLVFPHLTFTPLILSLLAPFACGLKSVDICQICCICQQGYAPDKDGSITAIS
jgi:hypothetical protein